MRLHDTLLPQTSIEKATLFPYTLMVSVSNLNKLWTCSYVDKTLNSSVDYFAIITCSTWLIYIQNLYGSKQGKTKVHIVIGL